jgi:fluoride ion exporter CrcB/FEX
MQGVTVIYSKRGGNTMVSSHSEWLLTVPAAPDVINVKLVPITSLLRGVAGTGFLGGFTTFSAVTVEVVRLAQTGRRRAATLHAVGLLVVSLVAAGLGWALGLAF